MYDASGTWPHETDASDELRDAVLLFIESSNREKAHQG